VFTLLAYLKLPQKFSLGGGWLQRLYTFEGNLSILFWSKLDFCACTLDQAEQNKSLNKELRLRLCTFILYQLSYVEISLSKYVDLFSLQCCANICSPLCFRRTGCPKMEDTQPFTKWLYKSIATISIFL
jgi:hypothetical protein